MRNKHFTRLVGILVGALLVLSLNTAMAQNKKGGVIRLETTTIEGRVQKPNAFFINTRQGLVYKGMALKESFLNEITKSVEDGEF